jgi:hypothetical protein
MPRRRRRRSLAGHLRRTLRNVEVYALGALGLASFVGFFWFVIFPVVQRWFIP